MTTSAPAKCDCFADKVGTPHISDCPAYVAPVVPEKAPPLTATQILTKMNTKSVGYTGLALTLLAPQLIALQPEIEQQMHSHWGGFVGAAGCAVVGGAMSLLGRWRTFEPSDTSAAGNAP
jgi:hypothetical protein